jgi:hypothetical protein
MELDSTVCVARKGMTRWNVGLILEKVEASTEIRKTQDEADLISNATAYPILIH